MPDQVKDYLIRGSALLEETPGFRLVGRDTELKKICGMLMRKNASNVLLVGPGGVGCSALCLGLQAMKSDPATPFDIVGKRLFWLDTDGLFSSGVQTQITESFRKLRRTLLRTANSVLIIDDFRDFVDAARNNHVTHLINSIMRDVNDGRYQCILEARDEDLETVLKCHSNMREIFTMLDVREPRGEVLKEIIDTATKELSSHHKIPVTEAAIHTAIDLTSKYHVNDMSLSRAQPERTLNLIDRALTSYRQDANSNPPHIQKLKSALLLLESEAARRGSDDLPAELAQQRQDLENTLAEAQADWVEKVEKLNSLHRAQRDGEELLLALEEELSQERERAKQAEEEPEEKPDRPTFSARLGGGGFGSKEEARISADIQKANQAIKQNKDKFQALTKEMNAGLELNPEYVTQEFSSISGIPADKLNQDEREKLLNLDSTLKARIFGQDHAVEKLVGAVLMSNAGLKEPDKPNGSFMFCGPSGVGKTEMAKVLALALKDSEKAMLRFDMSEYMEKHALAKLIGAPPGYEGYEAGGILTNSVRRNPHSIVLFDEIEKAHLDVFNVFLQVLDDGRLTDNRGLTVSFADTLIIMTTNIGQSHFLDGARSYPEAMADTMADLEDSFRPEFLNRFNGRENIIGFKRLPLDLIERIARRELDKVNARIANSGHAVRISLTDETIKTLCQDRYDPVHGARGIPGFFASRIYPAIARRILETPEETGEMHVGYDPKSQDVTISMQDAKAAE